MNDAEVAGFISERGPFTLPDVDRKIAEWEESRAEGKRTAFALVDNATAKFIGVAQLRKVKIVDGKAMITRLIVNPDFRSRGYGTEAGMLIMHYGFTTLGLRKIQSWVFGYNMRSLACVKKTGLVETEGVMRENRFWQGKYWDMHNFAAFKDKWLRDYWGPYVVKHGAMQ